MPHTSRSHIAIIGAGPAGLRAAEVAASAGAQVSVFDSKPSAGRKFLIAGKSGLNLTHHEPWEQFLEKYNGHELPTSLWNKILTSFDNQSLRQWATDLGINTFVASSGKVFPEEMKAAPLLKRWIDQLRSSGVNFNFRNHFIDFQHTDHHIKINFSTPDGPSEQSFDKLIFALGGGSWKNTGSTGDWVKIFQAHHIKTSPLTPSNCGWEVDWDTDFIQENEGLPLKNLNVKASSESRHGELVITRYGLEGGPIYRLGPALRQLAKPQITIDFKPSHSEEQLIAKMESAKRNLIHEAKLRWKLNSPTHALLQHRFQQTETFLTEDLAKSIKNFTIPLTNPRPIDEVISSAGGVQWSELDEHLMLKKFPNIYCIGEMLDWDAPTGGYLLQACFATGTWVGKSSSQNS